MITEMTVTAVLQRIASGTTTADDAIYVHNLLLRHGLLDAAPEGEVKGAAPVYITGRTAHGKTTLVKLLQEAAPDMEWVDVPAKCAPPKGTPRDRVLWLVRLGPHDKRAGITRHRGDAPPWAGFVLRWQAPSAPSWSNAGLGLAAHVADVVRLFPADGHRLLRRLPSCASTT